MTMGRDGRYNPRVNEPGNACKHTPATTAWTGD